MDKRKLEIIYLCQYEGQALIFYSFFFHLPLDYKSFLTALINNRVKKNSTPSGGGGICKCQEMDKRVTGNKKSGRFTNKFDENLLFQAKGKG